MNQDTPFQNFIPTLLSQPPVSVSQQQLFLPRELSWPCPLSGLPTFEGTWLFTIVEESSSMRVWFLFPDTGPKHPIKTTEGAEKHLFKQMWLLPCFGRGTCHPSWVFEDWGPAMWLDARLTYRELGFLWPSRWGGYIPTSSAEGSLFPLQGMTPSSSWESWHSLEFQNALQPASWWLPKTEPAAPEGMKDGR